MVKKQHTEKTVGPWAKRKLDALERYLEAYMTVMKFQRFKLVFIDAFAGAGIVRVRDKPNRSQDPSPSLLIADFDDDDERELEEFISGSPLRALNLSRRFDHYRFIDIDPKRAADLRSLAQGYDGCDIKVLEGEANEEVQRIAKVFTNQNWRGFAFLDPYGAHLHWDTLRAIAATGKFDVIINFPMGMTINRLVMRDAAEIPAAWQAQLDLCFGCPDWREVAFETQTGLWGERVVKRHDAGRRLLDLYVNRLEAIFGHVASPSLVLNTKGAPLYYLIWASSNSRGKSIANHILSLGERVSIGRGDQGVRKWNSRK